MKHSDARRLPLDEASRCRSHPRAEGAVALAAALPKCEALALLSVRGNPISAAGQTALRAAAARDSIDIIFHSGDSDVDSDGYYQYDSGDDYRYGDHGTDSD